jgi:hypothetical protein
MIIIIYSGTTPNVKSEASDLFQNRLYFVFFNWLFCNSRDENLWADDRIQATDVKKVAWIIAPLISIQKVSNLINLPCNNVHSF